LVVPFMEPPCPWMVRPIHGWADSTNGSEQIRTPCLTRWHLTYHPHCPLQYGEEEVTDRRLDNNRPFDCYRKQGVCKVGGKLEWCEWIAVERLCVFIRGLLGFVGLSEKNLWESLSSLLTNAWYGCSIQIYWQ
jgi:hypothetical protein